jgi:aminoacrylate hydrolase
LPEAAGLYYKEHGDPNTPPLILSSGLGGSANYWAPNIAALADRFRVIAYDHRGTGRSDRTCPEGLMLADLGADMLGLMDALGIESAAIVGHAIGGMAGLEAARAAPARVRRIVIINGWASLDPQTARCFDVRLTLLRKAGPAAYLEAQPLFLYPGDWLSEHDAALREEAVHQLAGWPGDTTMERRIAAARAFDCLDWAGEIEVPVLLVCASDDLLVPSFNSTRLQDLLIPHARGVEVVSGGHACNVTDPATFNRIVLDFLRS